MALIFREAVVGVKQESTKGTLNAPAASDAVYLAYDVTVSADREISSRNPIRSSISPVISAGKTSGSVSFRCEMIPSGTAGTAPDMDTSLLACGMAGTNTPSVSEVYAPESPGETYTVGVWHDGVAYQLKGALASCSISATIGEPLMATFTFTGVFNDAIDSSNPSVTYGSVSPPVMLGATATVGGTTCALTSWNMDIALDVQLPADATQSDGVTAYSVPVGRTVSGSLDPLLETVATRDDFGALAAGTAQDIVLTLGSTAGNKIQITVNDALLSKVSTSEREGAVVGSLDWSAGSAAGDGEFEIKFF